MFSVKTQLRAVKQVCLAAVVVIKQSDLFVVKNLHSVVQSNGAAMLKCCAMADTKTHSALADTV